ncbi:MAG TPA: PKD domain-containing protein [Baekduia sp.]
MSRVLAAAVALSMIICASAQADVVARGSASTTGTGTTVTIPSVTVANGTDRLLAVGVSTTDAVMITGVSYGGTALRSRAASGGDGTRAELWTLSTPAVGTAAVTVTFSGSAAAVVGATSFTGVDPIDPILLSTGQHQNNGSNAASDVFNNTTVNDGMMGVIAVGNLGNNSGLHVGQSTDLVTPDVAWNATAGVLGGGATRSGNTGANSATTAGIGWLWTANHGDLNPFSTAIMALRATEPAVGATVSGPTIANVTTSSATLGGTVISDGGGTVTQRGVVYCLGACVPALDGDATAVAAATGGTGTFTVPAPGLADNTLYTVRAYATNSRGTSYSESDTFTTLRTNAAPTASAGGPYSANEGASVTLNAGGSHDPDNDALTYAWDVDGDGAYDDATGVSPTLTAAQLATIGLGDGPDSASVRVQVKDPTHGAVTSAATTLTITNVLPSATLGNDGPVAEGADATISFTGATDPSSADQTAGFRYSFDLNNDGTYDVGNGTYAGSSTSASATLHTGDDGTYTVHAAIIDKDGGVRQATTNVVVTNAPPTATFGNDGPVDEGSDAHVSFTGATDPSPADTAAGFHYAYDLDDDGHYDVGDGTYAGSGTDASATFPTHDDGTYRVAAAIIDRDGGLVRHTTDVVVHNVAPSATLGNDGPVDEGADATVSFTGATDPSSADTAAGFHYAYDLDNDGTYDVGDGTYAGSVTAASKTFTTHDDGTYTVTAVAIDKDGGVVRHTTDVVVHNVAPTATLGNDGPVVEGSDATVSFTAPGDPSDADTTAGFHYAFDLDDDGTYDVGDGTYAGSPSSPDATLPTDDDGTTTVRAAIIDKDGGITDSTTDVVATNAAPTVAIAGPDATPLNTALTFTLDATDVSSQDTAGTFTYTITWGDGQTDTVTGPSHTTATHTYTASGDHTISVVATDKDGGDSTASTFGVTIPAPPAPPSADVGQPGGTPGAPVGGASTPTARIAHITSLSVAPRCVKGAAATTRAVTIRYKLDIAAKVRVSLQRSKASHAVRSCPPARGTKQKDGHLKAGTYAPVSSKQLTTKPGSGSLVIAKGTAHGAVGAAASVRPSALIAKGQKLRAGTYLLTLTALGTDGKAQGTARVKFWVLVS